MAVLLAALLALAIWLVYDGLTRPAGAAPNEDTPPSELTLLARLRAVLVPAEVPPLAFLLVSLGSGLALGLMAALLAGWPLVIVVAALGGMVLPGWVVRRRAAAERARRREALPEALEQLRATVQAGAGIPEALALLATAGPPALRPELALLALDLRLVGLAEALRRAKARWQDPLFVRAADALLLNDRLGGRHVGPLLEDLATAARAELAARREAQARQVELVLTARVVAVLPLLVLLLLRQVNPAYLEPYATLQGQLVLGGIALLVAAGYLLMRQAARLPGDEGERA